MRLEHGEGVIGEVLSLSCMCEDTRTHDLISILERMVWLQQ